MPGAARRIEPGEFVGLAQLYARSATVENAPGERFEPGTGPRSTSSSGPPASPARAPGTSSRTTALGERVRERTVGEVVEAARAAGAAWSACDGAVRVPGRGRASPRRLGGIRVDERAAAPPRGVWAAGADAGGISTGGWSSALAAALVLGRGPPRTQLG